MPAVIVLLAALGYAAPPDGVDGLLREAKRSGSSALYVEKDGKVLVDWHRGPVRPMRSMSMTKSIAAILVYQLRDEGRIASLDLPLSTWYPEISDATLAATPLSDVLSMTTGLERCEVVCDDGGDVIRYALASPRESPPGLWAYNNNAVNLVSGVVQRVSGVPMDERARTSLFEPLAITDATWERDRAGTTYVSAGLSLSVPDLVRIGQMLLGHGEWHGKRLLSAESVTDMTTPPFARPWYASLWYPVRREDVQLTAARLDYFAARGADPSTIDALRPLVGRMWPDARQAERDLTRALGPTGETRLGALWYLDRPYDIVGTAIGFAAEGQYGQYLVVLPRDGVVAVRVRRIGWMYRDDPKLDLQGFPQTVADRFAR